MSAKLNLVGKSFGRLLVTAAADSRSGRSYWKVSCTCGTSKEVLGKHLVSGAIVSCGCFSRERTSKVRRLDLTGRTFGRLFVVGDLMTRGRSTWECRCACGNSVEVAGDKLVSGNTKSCGCWQRAQARLSQTTHGMAGSPTYTAWSNMKSRCLNHASSNYQFYGYRGIKIDPSWSDFTNFLRDMGEKPAGLTLSALM